MRYLILSLFLCACDINRALGTDMYCGTFVRESTASFIVNADSSRTVRVRYEMSGCFRTNPVNNGWRKV